MFLNMQRVPHVPQAAAMAFPRKVILYDPHADNWSWPAAAAKLYGDKPPL